MADLPNRLRGIYPIGPILENGEPEFGYKQYEGFTPPIQIEAADEIERLRERLIWKPIETAPKDSGMFLVLLPRMQNLIIRARYDRVHRQWLTDVDRDGIKMVRVFHEGDLWQDMPRPPEKNKV